MNLVGTVATRDAEAELQNIFKGQWVHSWQVFRVLRKARANLRKSPRYELRCIDFILKVVGAV